MKTHIPDKPELEAPTTPKHINVEQSLENSDAIKQHKSAGNSPSDCSTKMRASSNVVLAHAQGCSIFDIDFLTKRDSSTKEEPNVPAVEKIAGTTLIHSGEEKFGDGKESVVEYSYRPDINYESDIDGGIS